MTLTEYTANIKARFGSTPLHVLENAAMRRSFRQTAGGKSAERLAVEREACQAVILNALAAPATVNDICTKTGMGYDRVLHHLRNMHRDGKVTQSTTQRPIVWGRAK